ncbi:DUF5677 domain-containing protein [Pseudoalteromonas sp. 20-MNA-CIBAN-0454]|uniref:DUF5677 domain-containing protein n=1 Tax=Pseudoalteromonas sp. 20-MNA-CIBAN-0454 TaxID=3140424 RepID=UPI00332DBCBC
MSPTERITNIRGDVNRLISLHKQNLYEHTLLAYSSSLLDLADAIITLSVTGKLSGIPILYRTFSETFVDFHNLSSDRDYGYRLQSNRLKEWIKVLEHLDPKHLEWLKESNELDDLVEFKAQLVKDKAELSDQFKPIKISAKFDLAGLKDFYETMYNELCSDSHSNLRSVRSRLCLNDNDPKIQKCIGTIPQALTELERTLIKVFQ